MNRKHLLYSVIVAVCVVALLTGCQTRIQPDSPIPSPERTTLEMPAPTATAAPQSAAAPSPAPTPTATPVPTPFSIVWLSDTQAISYHDYPGAFASMGAWIVARKEADNAVYVVQTGDIVDNGFVQKQWDHFDTCYHCFRDVLPYFPIAGNHDLGVKRGEYDAYLVQPFVRALPRENTFMRGRAAFATFSAGGTDFLLLGAGWHSESMAADWMNRVLAAHRDSVAILLFHAYIKPNGEFANAGEEMFHSVIEPNPNVRLVLCGHVRETGARIDEIDDDGDGVPDRRVHAMLYNYQDYSINCGQIRLLSFDPATRDITVTTYSPFTDYYYKDSHYKSAVFVLEDAF